MNLNPKTIKSACNYFIKELSNHYTSTDELKQTMQIAFSHLFGWSKVDLVLNEIEEISETDYQKIIELITALKINKPLAQIIGEWEFYGLTFKVNEHTLIPRPETEELVQFIVKEANNTKNLEVLDIGTGTGCIAIALKKELNLANVLAVDIADEALSIATKNAQLNNLNVTFKQLNILDWKNEKIAKKFDVIVSNPPYITEKEKESMHTNVLDFEPHFALFVDNKTPLLFYDTIAAFALTHLKNKGKLYFEINENFGKATQQCLIDKGFKNVTLAKDMNEKDRIIKAIF